VRIVTAASIQRDVADGQVRQVLVRNPASWESTSKHRSRRPNMPRVHPWLGRPRSAAADFPRPRMAGCYVVIVDARNPASQGCRRRRAAPRNRATVLGWRAAPRQPVMMHQSVSSLQSAA